MKIALLITIHGYSFKNQGEALKLGLNQLGIDNRLFYSETENWDLDIKHYSPDLVLSIGSWQDYPSIVELPIKMGLQVIPWLVADEKVEKYIEDLNSLKLLLATSENSRQLFIKSGINQNIIQVLPEAVDNTYWNPSVDQKTKDIWDFITLEKNAELLNRFNIKRFKEKGGVILFTTGGDATRKGAYEVIKALGKIYSENKQLEWIYLIKTWPSTTSFQASAIELELADKLNIWDRISYIVGEVSQDFIKALMLLSDIYVSPSRFEGFGLPLVEAQMCAKPVITCMGTAAAELVVNGKTGFVVKSHPAPFDKVSADIDDLAIHLKKLMQDKDLRNSFGVEGKHHAIKNYSPAVIARKLQEKIEIF